jgi:hypothetical protein
LFSFELHLMYNARYAIGMNVCHRNMIAVLAVTAGFMAGLHFLLSIRLQASRLGDSCRTLAGHSLLRLAQVRNDRSAVGVIWHPARESQPKRGWSW